MTVSLRGIFVEGLLALSTSSSVCSHLAMQQWQQQRMSERLPEHLCALAQTFYLTQVHCRMLKEEEGVEAWCFEQHANEAVFIPAGCPHQVLFPDSSPLTTRCIVVGLGVVGVI